jgi:beta-phosphoglucomutase|tara:strand:+ start:811 stop:1434 length:624 start_codon:yes stop_codon:yes gene_type:complete
MIKAILYDLDGVLVDTTEWHYDALNEALMEVAGFTIERNEHLNIFNGLPTKKKLEILESQDKIKKSMFEKIWNIKQEKTLEVIKQSAQLDETKRRLHSNTKNFKKICVTNSIKETAILMLEKTGQLEFMDKVISNEDVSNPKPDPEGYLQAIKFLKLESQECMIIEDNEKGIIAANKSGAFVYEVLGYQEVTLENILSQINYFNKRI